jgi:hypothetical protein
MSNHVKSLNNIIKNNKIKNIESKTELNKGLLLNEIEYKFKIKVENNKLFSTHVFNFISDLYKKIYNTSIIPNKYTNNIYTIFEDIMNDTSISYFKLKNKINILMDSPKYELLFSDIKNNIRRESNTYNIVNLPIEENLEEKIPINNKSNNKSNNKKKFSFTRLFTMCKNSKKCKTNNKTKKNISNISYKTNPLYKK